MWLSQTVLCCTTKIDSFVVFVSVTEHLLFFMLWLELHKNTNNYVFSSSLNNKILAITNY